MAETDKHRRLMSYVTDALEVYYADRPDVYVSGNNFVFWEEGNPKARISPDGYVVFGVPQRQRDSYMAWKEGGHLPGRHLGVHVPQDPAGRHGHETASL